MIREIRPSVVFRKVTNGFRSDWGAQIHAGYRSVTAAPRNLFEYLHHSLVVTAAYLEIRTPIVVSSTIAVDHGLKSAQKVIAICEALGADRYVNFVGGAVRMALRLL